VQHLGLRVSATPGSLVQVLSGDGHSADPTVSARQTQGTASASFCSVSGPRTE